MRGLVKEVVQPVGGRTCPRAVWIVADADSDAARVRSILERETFDPDLEMTHSADGADLRGAGADLAVMLDPTLPEIRAVASVSAGTRVVAVIDESSGITPRQFLDAGASAVVTRAMSDEVLGPACRLVMSGHICVPASGAVATGLPELSLRERQVLALIAAGLNNAEIAERLYLSVSTVKSHTASAFRRLGVRSRREAVTVVLGTNQDLRRLVLTAQPVELTRLRALETE